MVLQNDMCKYHSILALDDGVQSYLPELLGRILPADSFQDFCTAGVLVDKVCYVVHCVIDDDVLAVACCRGVLRHVGGCECLRHFAGGCQVWVERKGEQRVR